MPMSNFPYGFAQGVSVRGVPLFQAQPGKVFWLNNSSVLGENSTAGSDGNDGTYTRPFATLAGALLKCTAGRGDVIFVMPGHAESISSATALNLNISGVAIIGLGSGTLRPTFTLDTANTSTITVSAASVSIQNCAFVANFLNIATLFTLTTAKDFSVNQCYIVDTSATLNFLNLFTTNATANAADGLAIQNNMINLKATTGVVNLLALGAALDRSVISGNSYLAQTTNAGAIIVASTFAMTNASILNNTFNIQNAAATATGIWFTGSSTACTGFIDGNKGFSLAYPAAAPALLVTATAPFVFGTNYTTHTITASSVVNPTAAA